MTPELHLKRYSDAANDFPPGAVRTMLMLGMMASVAAACNELVPMPRIWGWPGLYRDDAADPRETKQLRLE